MTPREPEEGTSRRLLNDIKFKDKSGEKLRTYFPQVSELIKLLF